MRKMIKRGVAEKVDDDDAFHGGMSLVVYIASWFRSSGALVELVHCHGVFRLSSILLR